MDKERIRQLLPEEPPEGLLEWTKRHCDGELGPAYLTWKSVSVPVYNMDYLMGCSSKPSRRERVAECTCLKCGSKFVTEKIGNTLIFWVDECGEWWPLDPNGTLGQGVINPLDAEDNDTGYRVDVDGDNEAMQCPMCYETVRSIPAKNLRGGRRKQILVNSIQTVEQYAVVVYWLVCRTIYEEGHEYQVFPRDAYVLDEKGNIHRYSHKSGGGAFYVESQDDRWRYVSNKRDSLGMCYHDWGSISNKKKGGIFYEEVPDLTGTTAEKTGLQSFADHDGTCSVEYLKLWKKYPHLENLVNTGWNQLVNAIVCSSSNGYSAAAEMYKVIDIGCTKPHEMLGLTRSDFKAIRKAGKQWEYECQKMWQVFRTMGTTAHQFLIYRDMFTDTGLRTLLTLRNEYGETDIEKIIRYLKKQKMRPAEVRILLDTRNAARELAIPRPLTQEELWPRNLQAAHDRYTRMRMEAIDQKKVEKFQAGFNAVLDKYGDLQWTDGDLCIILPKSYAELVQEGNVLRHCVGGYGGSHITGRDTIFFVRRYRRPERNYYTLDINMTDKPHRVQLHGYGNERHGINKQYSHRIPQKVLDFCARWEREILMPWWRDNQKEKEKTA